MITASDETIKRYMEILKEDFDREVDYETAQDEANSLLEFFTLLYQANQQHLSRIIEKQHITH